MAWRFWHDGKGLFKLSRQLKCHRHFQYFPIVLLQFLLLCCLALLSNHSINAKWLHVWFDVSYMALSILVHSNGFFKHFYLSPHKRQSKTSSNWMKADVHIIRIHFNKNNNNENLLWKRLTRFRLVPSKCEKFFMPKRVINEMKFWSHKRTWNTFECKMLEKEFLI